MGPLINDLRFLLQSLQQWMVNHVPREGNSAAHHLARMGVGSSQTFCWFEDPSDFD